MSGQAPPGGRVEPAMEAVRFERRARIRFSHCDPAGIVFYPQYFVLFNGLVEDWVTEALGIPYAELIGVRKIGLPTVSVESTFTAVSRMGDDVVLGLAVERIGKRSVTLALDGRGAPEQGSETLRVQVRNVLVTTDLLSHQAIDIPSDLRASIQSFANPS